MSGTALTFPTPVSLGSLDHYIQAVNRFPLLTQEQETALGRRWREHEDIDAARELVLSHLRLVVAVSRNYLGYGLPQADLIQEGNGGLMKAVRTFAERPIGDFTDYAATCIDAAKNYTAEMKTTKGTMTIELDPKRAPKTVNNFVFLARYHYYDGFSELVSVRYRPAAFHDLGHGNRSWLDHSLGLDPQPRRLRVAVAHVITTDTDRRGHP